MIPRGKGESRSGLLHNTEALRKKLKIPPLGGF
jgi:hypothetical protein